MSKKAKLTFLDYCFRISGLLSVLGFAILFYDNHSPGLLIDAPEFVKIVIAVISVTCLISVIPFLVSALYLPFRNTPATASLKVLAILSSLCLVGSYIAHRITQDRCQAGIVITSPVYRTEGIESMHKTTAPTREAVPAPPEPKFDSKKPLLSSGKVEGVTCNLVNWLTGGLGKLIFTIILVMTAFQGIKVSLTKRREKKQGNTDNPPGDL